MITVGIDKNNLGSVELLEAQAPQPRAGELLLQADHFALSANNISYAAVGEALGYWNFFPTSSGHGCVPVWGFATVVASNVEGIAVGERVFGYLPMATHLLVKPSGISDLCFSDTRAHKANLHPWYNRYYRCSGDPGYLAEQEPLQAVMWALFMTGWMMAADFAENVDTVVVSSASSKTALALAWSIKHRGNTQRVIGLTSEGNKAFTEARGVYDQVVTYDNPLSLRGCQVAYVDIAGNNRITSAVHVELGEQLVESVTIGGTHKSPPDPSLPMPGPAPRFFFIPDVAEQHADNSSLQQYHETFSAALVPFIAWTSQWLNTVPASGSEAVKAAYLQLLTSSVPPDEALVFTWD